MPTSKMLSEKLKEKIDQMSALVSEMQAYWGHEENLQRSSASDSRAKELIAQYHEYLTKLAEQFRAVNLSLLEEIGGEIPEAPPHLVAPSAKTKAQKVVVPKEKKGARRQDFFLKKREKKSLLADINLTEKQMREFIRSRTRRKIVVAEREKFSIYKVNPYGKIANIFFERLTLSLVKRYPKFFDDLSGTLRSADIKILSKTYISMILLSTALAFFLVSLGFLGYTYLFGKLTLFSIAFSAAYGIVGGTVVFAFSYFYPHSVMAQKRGSIKRDIPFAVIHMSAVASSGANPIAMFDLLLKSGDYPGLESEIRKIVNYVNLFGYDLPTAMRNVAMTTPSSELKSILNGIISNTESGGSLKDYLKEKTDDVLNIYRLDRKKYVSAMATYSDIYTGLLIAAPLLFFTTLAIINLIGGNIGGFGVSTIATVGTFAVIPLLNLLFIFFITIMEPK